MQPNADNDLSRDPFHTAIALVQQWGVAIKSINHRARTIDIINNHAALRLADSHPFISLDLGGGARKVHVPYRGCTVRFVQHSVGAAK